MAEDKHQPLYKELVENYKVEYIAGGSAQNSIRVAQWMMNKPNSTSYIGAIGKDAYGAELEKCATSDGVNAYYSKEDTAATGTCAVLIHKKERSLVANLAACSNYKIKHLLSDTITPVWENAKIIYTTGFFLGPVSPDSILHLAKHSHENNKTFCINLSAPFVPEFFNDQLMSIMPYVDYIFGNESEFKAFAKKHGYEDDSPSSVILKVAALPKENKKKHRIAIVTQGKDPTLVAIDGKVTSYKVDLVPNDQIVDLNGAGDAFVGGFLAYLAQGYDISVCVLAGHYSASRIITVSGTNVSTFGAPNFKPASKPSAL